MNNLNLYAKIEPMIGFYEEYEKLYVKYLKELQVIEFDTLLDVGCGNGKFLQTLIYCEAKGIDISEEMVTICKEKNLNVECKKIEEVSEKFDVVTAIADVLNYLDDDNLKSFLNSVERVLNKGGYFLFDVNTLYGFSEVADGVMVSENESGFLSVSAEFFEERLYSDFTYFEKEKSCYKKHSWQIVQYFHDEKELLNLSSLKLVKTVDINLFSDDLPDKKIYIMKKV